MHYSFVHNFFKYFRKTQSEEKMAYSLIYLSYPLSYKGNLQLYGKVTVANRWLHVLLTGSLIRTEQVFIILLDTSSYRDEVLLLRDWIMLLIAFGYCWDNIYAHKFIRKCSFYFRYCTEPSNNWGDISSNRLDSRELIT